MVVEELHEVSKYIPMPSTPYISFLEISIESEFYSKYIPRIPEDVFERMLNISLFCISNPSYPFMYDNIQNFDASMLCISLNSLLRI